MSERIRILLADDHAIFRSGLEALLRLEPDMEVVGKVGTGEEAVERVNALHPDVVVMDLGMPGIGGLEATRQIAALRTDTRVLVLTSHAEDEYLLSVLEAGAHGFVHKASADEDLTSAIRLVARDEVFLYPNATKLLLRGFKQAVGRGQARPLEELSERETEVLELTARGYSSAEAAKKLFLSPKTVDTYRSRLMRKLGLSRRTELVTFALDSGVLAAGKASPAGAGHS
ncbi:MAG TPA: response regulator transcription factor [Longimicrobiaceae bacterium]